MKRFSIYGFVFLLFTAACFVPVACTPIQPESPDKTGKPEQKKLEQKIENLTQKLEQAGKRQEALEEKIGMLNRRIREMSDKKETEPTALPDTKGEYTEPAVLYKKGRSLMLEERFSKASLLFSEFVNAYPAHRLADNAMYWLGECHYSVGEFNRAADTFLMLVEQYPDGMKVPDALLKAGYSYLAVDDVNRAHHYLKKVVKQFPFTKAGEKAEVKLKTIE